MRAIENRHKVTGSISWLNREPGDGVLSAIGRTPLVRLKQVFPNSAFELFAKLECVNPAGSLKDRAAMNMIRHALTEGLITSRSVIVESSSGNMGIGLAQACA